MQPRSGVVWLCCRLVAIALTQPLALEPPYAMGAAPPPKKKWLSGQRGFMLELSGTASRVEQPGSTLRVAGDRSWVS